MGPIILYLRFPCFWTVGGSQSTREEPTRTQVGHENSSQKHPDLGSNLLFLPLMYSTLACPIWVLEFCLCGSSYKDYIHYLLYIFTSHQRSSQVTAEQQKTIQGDKTVFINVHICLAVSFCLGLQCGSCHSFILHQPPSGQLATVSSAKSVKGWIFLYTCVTSTDHWNDLNCSVVSDSTTVGPVLIEHLKVLTH